VRHSIQAEGLCYRLRPIEMSDARAIVDIRLEDADRNKFIHRISPEVKLQEKWLSDYFKREGDYYFAVENKFTGQMEGLISIYDVAGKRAEWGRYVMRRNSLAAVESAALCLQTAFEVLALDEVYGGIVSVNKAVISLHKRFGSKIGEVISNAYEIDGQLYDKLETSIDRQRYLNIVKPRLEEMSKAIYERFAMEMADND